MCEYVGLTLTILQPTEGMLIQLEFVTEGCEGAVDDGC
jgi:hypothetical protein